MLKEIILDQLTQAPQSVRDLGYVRGLISIGSRYNRVKAFWKSHLQETRKAILEAAAESPGKNKIIIIGTGLWLDVPVKELSRQFKKVVLVDIVHLPPQRLCAALMPPVELRREDVTGLVEPLHRLGLSNSWPEQPIFRRQPFELDQDADLVISCNILSQLAVMPIRWFKACKAPYRGRQLDSFGRQTIDQHLAMLVSHPGQRYLISDITRHLTDGDKEEVLDPLYGLPLDAPRRTWQWQIAPRPEAEPGRDYINKVGFWKL